jgi:ketosteroid isomerase-like protein
MPRLSQRVLLTLALLSPLAPVSGRAQAAARPGAASVEDEVRAATREYDAALRSANAAVVTRFWADEYTFVNARGEQLTRADRVANLRAARTTFDTLAPAPNTERVRAYGPDVAVHTALLTIRGRYSGQAHAGDYRALVVWARRGGRWQQVVSQLTAVAAPAGAGAR